MNLLQSLYLDWFSGPLRGKYFEVRHIPHSAAAKRVYREFHGAPCAVKQRPGYHLFFCVNPRIARGDGKSISHAVALYADVDEYTKSTRFRIREFQPRVSAVIATGRGLHCYWFLQEPVPGEKANNVPSILRGIATHLRADSRCTSLQQPLRMPGSVNPKNGRICRELFVDPARRYALDEFEDYGVLLAPRPRSGLSSSDRIPVALPRNSQVPTRFMHDLRTSKKLQRLWDSSILPEFTKNGQPNGSDRDFSIALMLTWRGYKPEQIASILLAAPYFKRFLRTGAYLRFTISRAYQVVEAARRTRLVEIA